MTRLSDETLEELMLIAAHPEGARGRMRDIELARGSTGELPLDPNDWHSGLVMIRGMEARILLLDARRPGAGAFKRLLGMIRHSGLLPVVVAPMGDRMPAILRKWGWKCQETGEGFDRAEEWRP